MSDWITFPIITNESELWFLPPANEVWGKVICLQVCVCPQEGGRGVSGPGGCLFPWGSGPGGVPGGEPLGRLLLRAVRILLKCILVQTEFQEILVFLIFRLFIWKIMNIWIHMCVKHRKLCYIYEIKAKNAKKGTSATEKCSICQFFIFIFKLPNGRLFAVSPWIPSR